MNKKLITTVCDGRVVDEYGKYTLPIIKKYAEDCGADFMNLTQPCSDAPGMWNYRTMIFTIFY